MGIALATKGVIYPYVGGDMIYIGGLFVNMTIEPIKIDVNMKSLKIDITLEDTEVSSIVGSDNVGIEYDDNKVNVNVC